MNEQLIKKFTSQCGIEYDSDDGADDESLRKYTELIVQECMSIIKQGDGLGNEDDFDKGFQAGIAMAYNRIRAQMGVEE